MKNFKIARSFFVLFLSCSLLLFQNASHAIHQPHSIISPHESNLPFAYSQLLTTMPHCVEVDQFGFIYIAGTISNPRNNNDILIGQDIPGIFTAYQGGLSDGFLIKLNPTATEVVFGTFIGGDQDDEILSLAVDHNGDAYIAGHTTSEASTFPIGGTVPGFQTELKGKSDGFIMKINTLENRIEYATYLGGNSNDTITSLAIDKEGSVYVGGVTFSDPDTFPVMESIPGFQKEKGAMWSGFAAKLDPTGTHLLYSTYIGGNKGDDITSIALDQDNNLYIGGYTYSTEDSFPIGGDIPGFCTQHKGIADGFILKLNHDGTEVLYSTYIGSDSLEWITSIAVDHKGAVYATGWLHHSKKFETSFDFPVGGDIPGYNTIYHAGGTFVVKLNPQGTELDYATFISTCEDDVGVAIRVDNQGNAYLLTQTSSPGMPTHRQIPSIQRTYQGKEDIFFIVLDSTGTEIKHSSYIGGQNVELALSFTLHDDLVILSGTTMSTNEQGFPIGGDISGYNETFTSNNGAFILGISMVNSEIMFSTSLVKK